MSVFIINLPSNGIPLYQKLQQDEERLGKYLEMCESAAVFPKATADLPLVRLMTQMCEIYWATCMHPYTGETFLPHALLAIMTNVAETVPDLFGPTFGREVQDGEFPKTHEFGRFFAMHEEDKQRNLAILEVMMENRQDA